MRVDNAAIAAGIEIGLRRSVLDLRNFQVDDAEALRHELGNMISSVIERFQPNRPWGPRGQRIYAELGAMAAAARIHYQERPMDSTAAYEVLNPLTRFLNSWLHE